MRWTLVMGGYLGLGSALTQSGLDLLKVDLGRSNIPVSQIQSGGPPPQGIPALGFIPERSIGIAPTPDPQFISAEEAKWLGDQEPVIYLRLVNQTKAYPLQILMWHEIANDSLSGIPLAITFCPLCNSALIYDRRIPLSDRQRMEVLQKYPKANIVVLDSNFRQAYAEQEGKEAPPWGLLITFGTSGLLYNSNLLMFDSVTNTLFSQILGEGNVGTLTGVRLLRYAGQVVSFKAFQNSGGGVILSRNTGFNRAYGQNPYLGYDRADEPPFLFQGPINGKLPPKQRVVAVEIRSEAVAYPFSRLTQLRVINDQIGSTPMVVLWLTGTRSVLDSTALIQGRDIGSVGVFDRRVDGRTLSFVWNGSAFQDEQTKTLWSLTGRAISGPLRGQRLRSIPHDNTLWFAWAAFKPLTRIFGW